SAGPGDQGALLGFFQGLSAESRWRRFFSVSLPRPEQVGLLCNGLDPQRDATLLVARTQGGGQRIIGCGSYQAKDATTAEVALAVDDAFQGKGLGTLLLERLALQAVRHGFTHFWAVTHADNRAMRDVFHASGFAVEEKPERGEVEV